MHNQLSSWKRVYTGQILKIHDFTPGILDSWLEEVGTPSSQRESRE